jgi:hypothetical protein
MAESKLNEAMKTAYVAGLFDGAATTGLELVSAECAPPECDGKSLEKLFEIARTKYFHATPVEQFKQGIDKFFRIPENRQVHVSQAAVISLMQIAGEPEEIIRALTEEARKLAARPKPGG